MPNDLIALIKQKQDAIAKLEAELAEARTLLLKSATRPDGVVPASPRESKVRGTKKPLRRSRGRRVGVPGIVPTSSVGLTVPIIRHAGRPLHINEIIAAIEAAGRTVNRTTLVGNLSRYVTKKRIFYRPAPSTFGLLEMKKGA
jgi:hypothetical protein